MPAAALKRFVIFGGGRWARTLVRVLRNVLPDQTEILWVSKHSHGDAQSWLVMNPVSNLRLLQHLDLAESEANAVIVATSPESHFALVQKAVQLGLPTLCEKPIASCLQQAQELLTVSDARHCPVGMNLEFLFASYLHDFAEQIRDIRIDSVHIDWMDPWCEDREGERKYGEMYVDLMLDQLPHCWSLLTVIQPDESGLLIKDVRYSPSSVDVFGMFGGVATSICLSRRAAKRVRRVSVVDRTGQDIVFDFSHEPGSVSRYGNVTANRWTGDRPLTRSLSSFVNVVLDPDQQRNWTLSLWRCFDAVASGFTASAKLQSVQDQQIAHLMATTRLNTKNPEHVQLIVDRFLPLYAVQGQRLLARTMNEQLLFADKWLSTQLE